ncbi:MAG: hypothetical protein SPH93_14255 [Clostridium sp.]|uniref:hypothetical protein n=1 Tax=Clostridium sp. TaxID=1506 RepID=UPI002A913D84|nr:hypothetical protein [Clostridium sp.]MDY6228799.1 hypothetical protein [Clostridium sp.]
MYVIEYVIEKKLLDTINNSKFEEKLVHKHDRIIAKYKNDKYELDLIIRFDYVISISIEGVGGFSRKEISELRRSGGSNNSGAQVFKKFIDSMKLGKEKYKIKIYLAPTTLDKLKKKVSIDLTDEECVKEDFISKVKRCYDFEIDKNKIEVDYKATHKSY